MAKLSKIYLSSFLILLHFLLLSGEIVHHHNHLVKHTIHDSESFICNHNVSNQDHAKTDSQCQNTDECEYCLKLSTWFIDSQKKELSNNSTQYNLYNEENSDNNNNSEPICILSINSNTLITETISEVEAGRAPPIC